jgi:hypothetical protein
VVVSAGSVVVGVGVADGGLVGGSGFILSDGLDFPGGLVNWSYASLLIIAT